MPLNQALLPEFDHEMANTRKALERVPDDKLDWQPHEKSMTLRRLAQHIAEIPGWGVQTLEKESVDVAPAGAPPYQPPAIHSHQDVLRIFDENAAAARKAIEAVTDESLMKKWTLLSGGKEIFSAPRVAVWRGFVMNHLVHHRGQLTVYLRLNNVPVPSLYGPSADEGRF